MTGRNRFALRQDPGDAAHYSCESPLGPSSGCVSAGEASLGVSYHLHPFSAKNSERDLFFAWLRGTARGVTQLFGKSEIAYVNVKRRVGSPIFLCFAADVSNGAGNCDLTTVLHETLYRVNFFAIEDCVDVMSLFAV